MGNTANNESINMEISSKIHNPQTPYKTWPVYTIAFLKTLYQSIYSLALPNFLIYTGNMNADLIGVIMSMTSLAYIITPVIGQKIAKYIGYKYSLMFSLILSGITYTLQIVIFTPAIFISMQLLEGLSLGLFWPNLMMQISVWQNISTKEQNDRNFKHFNKSWNYGLLSGFIIGFLIVRLFNNEKFALITAVILVFVLIPVGFFVDSKKKLVEIQKTYELQSLQTISTEINNNDIPMDSLQKDKNLSQNEKKAKISYIHLIIPAMIAWTLNLGYTTSKSMYNFIFPFNLKSASIGSEWRYLFMFAQQTLQIIGLNLIGPMKLKTKDLIVKFCLIFDFILIIGMLIFQNIYFIIFATIIMGLSTGFKQGFVMKINFDHSAHHNDSKYINIGEIVGGMGFGITPLWVGLIVNNLDYRWNYFILMFISSLVAIYYWITLRNIKKN